MKILTGLVILYSVGDEPLGSRNLAPSFSHREGRTRPIHWYRKEIGDLARGQHLVRISVTRVNSRTSGRTGWLRSAA